MAHEITSTDHMVSAHQTPWHGLGTVTDHALSLDEALTLARLDWEVEKRPLYVQGPAGLTLVDGRWATCRTDSGAPLGVVGDSYEVLQNAEGFDILGVLLEGGEVLVETAGSLRGGRIVWALARLHRDLRVGGDQHVPYILFVTWHDGTGAARVAPTPVRVVCNNTLRMALSKIVNQWTIRHTLNMKDRVQEARDALGLSWAYLDEFEVEAQKLIDQSVTDAQFEQIVAEVFPLADDAKKQKTTLTTRQRDEVKALWTSPEVGDVTGTAWGAVQAFSTWDLWKRGGRGDNADESQAMRIVSGRSLAFNQQVLAATHKIVVPA